MNNRKPRNKHNNYSKKPEFDVRTVCPGIKVTIQGDDERSFTKAFRIFNKKVQESRLLQDIREREYYEKPSIVRKRKKEIAIKREAKRREGDVTKRKRLY
jgi:small subunit ribosomal protein S21